MIIPINSKYRIFCHYYGCDVQKSRKIKSKAVVKSNCKWDSISYHPNRKSAIKWLTNLMIRQSETNSIAEATKAVKTVVNSVCQALDKQFEESMQKLDSRLDRLEFNNTTKDVSSANDNQFKRRCNDT